MASGTRRNWIWACLLMAGCSAASPAQPEVGLSTVQPMLAPSADMVLAVDASATELADLPLDQSARTAIAAALTAWQDLERFQATSISTEAGLPHGPDGLGPTEEAEADGTLTRRWTRSAPTGTDTWTQTRSALTGEPLTLEHRATESRGAREIDGQRVKVWLTGGRQLETLRLEVRQAGDRHRLDLTGTREPDGTWAASGTLRAVGGTSWTISHQQNNGQQSLRLHDLRAGISLHGSAGRDETFRRFVVSQGDQAIGTLDR